MAWNMIMALLFSISLVSFWLTFLQISIPCDNIEVDQYMFNLYILLTHILYLHNSVRSLENWYYRILILMTGNLKNAKIAVDALSVCQSINGWEMMIPLAFFAGVAIGSGWQAFVAYINIACYYIVGVPLGILMGWVFHFGVMVRTKDYMFSVYLINQRSKKYLSQHYVGGQEPDLKSSG
ncbi:hypothetical protein AQUCO_01000096v1 [Aquilegia coerulea]|uniref:ABC transmembrane type-1 domain-containing protein n=1 Tax=Aquilegia coerulea TaxID=218851 RepID=A0A2G5E8B9_AQUCA|nr:hypothetical protein AQUCO_01000096v1 [Aquilegia coerulea]